MRKFFVGNQFLLGILLSLSLVSVASADPTPLPNNRHIFIDVANTSGVKYSIDGPKYGGPTNSYYIKSDGGGLNSEYIAPNAADTTGSATVVPSPTSTSSGTIYLTDGGGRGFSDDMILLLSVKGPIPDNFSVRIKSSGYSWTPATPGPYNPSKPTTASTGLLGTATSPLADGSLNGLPIQGTNMVYLPTALDETFTKADFIYGPQTAKPGPGTLGVWSLPLYPGQLISDPSTAEYLMFIDLNVGAMRDSTLIDNGTAKVDFTFNNLYGDASFNMYGWVAASNQGQGISFTNPSTTDGYTVSYTGSPVANAKYSVNGPYNAGTNVTITAEFSKNVADSPVPTITLTGADALTAEMTKIDANHYSYSYTAGSGNGDVSVSFNANDASGNPLSLVTAGGSTFTLDNTAPVIASMTPADGTTDVPIATQLVATFSEPMDPATITSDTFQVGGVAGQVSFDAGSNTATFTPTAALANSTVYTATITGAKDLAGNAIAPSSWSFTTAAPPDTTPPTAQISYSPAGPYKAGTPVTVTATFSEAMADSQVPQIALSGADTVAPVNMVKSDITHYSYSYTAGSGNGDVSVALSNGTDLAWNPVVSVPTGGASFTIDNTSPTIASSTPAEGAIDVAKDSQVAITFSEGMDPATINSSTITLNGVSASVSYDPSTRVAKLTPNSALDYSTVYTATVTGAKDLAGNAIAPATWTFMTSQAPDTTPPTAELAYSSPAGVIVMGAPVTITAAFSEAMADSPAPMIALSGADTVQPVAMTRVDATHYSYSYTAGRTVGDVTVTVSNGTDLAGNPVVSTPTGGNTFKIAYPEGNMTGAPTVSVADALLALQTVAGLHTPTLPELTRGDVGPLVNGKPSPDGKIGIEDVVLILQKAVGKVSW